MGLRLGDLFVVQRVNKTWKSVIRWPEVIQKKMFLLPNGPALEPPPIVEALRTHERMYIEFDEPYKGSFRINPMQNVECVGEAHDAECDETSCNHEDCEPRSAEHSCNTGFGCVHVLRNDRPGMLANKSFIVAITAVPRKGALSAGNMLLTQPPLTLAGAEDPMQVDSGITLGNGVVDCVFVVDDNTIVPNNNQDESS